MKSSDVHRVLRGVGVTHLHHANTVTTSCTFLEHAALLSRRYVEKHGLPQTYQTSDDVDKRYGIWDCVFLDHVDIHYRGGRVKGPNQYGPVLFVFDLDLLLKLPAGTEIRVTTMNPIHWSDSQSDADRWYLKPEDLERNFAYGNFDKMLVIQVASGKVDFSGRQAQIALDEPRRKLSSGQDAYAYAEHRLRKAAKAGGVKIAVNRHDCRPDCICVEKYKRYEQGFFDTRFS